MPGSVPASRRTGRWVSRRTAPCSMPAAIPSLQTSQCRPRHPKGQVDERRKPAYRIARDPAVPASPRWMRFSPRSVASSRRMRASPEVPADEVGFRRRSPSDEILVLERRDGGRSRAATCHRAPEALPAAPLRARSRSPRPSERRHPSNQYARGTGLKWNKRWTNTGNPWPVWSARRRTAEITSALGSLVRSVSAERSVPGRPPRYHHRGSGPRGDQAGAEVLAGLASAEPG